MLPCLMNLLVTASALFACRSNSKLSYSSPVLVIELLSAIILLIVMHNMFNIQHIIRNIH